MECTRLKKLCENIGARIVSNAKKLLADERGYIDPGTGSMLFTILIGLITAGVYALRNAVVKLRFFMTGGRQEKADASVTPIAIFADSKHYWNVFEPICDELEKRCINVRYLTASSDDPALAKDYEYISCEFIGEGNKAFAKMNILKADVVLSTTPGLDVYQWKRSRDVKWYVHVFHALDDATKYRMFGLDYYDAILLVGDFQFHQVRELEQLRNLPEKELLLGGLTYMDRLKERLDSADDAPAHETTVLLAPSWGPSSIFSQFGGEVIEALLKTGYHIVVRPHPQSFISEIELMDKLMAQYPDSEQLEWNRDNDNFDVLRRSDIMISDYSGVVYDFALVFDKPVIYTEPVFDDAPYDACWLDEELWMFRALARIGHQLSVKDLDGLKGIIDDCLRDEELKEARAQVKNEAWACQGESAAVVADYLVAKYEELCGDAEE